MDRTLRLSRMSAVYPPASRYRSFWSRIDWTCVVTWTIAIVIAAGVWSFVGHVAAGVIHALVQSLAQ